MQSNTPDTSATSADAVLAQLSRILEHPSFAAAASQRRFLRFVTEETLAGRGAQLKEQVIGVEVFERGPSFDPRLDTIVRVEARRLRAKLASYYSSDGAGDPLIIELPKGAYVPSFQPRAVVASRDSVRWRATGAGVVAITVFAVAVWALTRAHVASSPQTAAASVAVLPFINVGGDPAMDYFADGLTTELISSLAEVDGLKVIATSSVFHYKGKARDIRRIGADLSVRTVVDGSVRRSGSQIRVAASLVDVKTGFQILSRSYDRELRDMFAIQRDIAGSITDALRIQTAQPHAAAACADNAESYDLYLRALYSESRRDSADLERSLTLLQRAVALNPRCPAMLARLAECYVLLGFYGLRRPVDVMPKAKSGAVRALELDPSLSQAHAALGAELALYEWNWNRAEEEFHAALRPSPGSPESHQWYAAFVLTPERRSAEAIAEARQAQRLSPLSLLARCTEGYSLFFADRWDEAIRHARQMIELDATFYHPYLYLGWSLENKGRLSDALDALLTANRLSGSNNITRYELAVAYARLGDRGKAVSIAGELERAAQAGADVDVPLAHIYAALGERSTALRWLSRACQYRSPMLVYINVAHDYDGIRSTPEFLAISRAVALPD